MTCRCNFMSPFLWRSNPCESQFMQDQKFYKGAATGKTPGQTATQTVIRFEERTGRSNGTVHGISDKSDKQTEAHMQRRRSASHYGKKA